AKGRSSSSVTKYSIVSILSKALTTARGITYKDVTVVRANKYSLSIQHSSGIAEIPFSELSEEIQKQYGYDPIKAAEEQRQLAAQRAAQKAREEAPLNGQDLVAWKLARKAAESHLKRLSRPVRVRVPGGAAVKGSRSAYAIEVNAQFAATAPRYALQPQPLRKYMRKSKTDDWIFYMPVRSSYYSPDTKGFVDRSEYVVVQVTDYGNEIRVEKCTLQRSP
ncbi:hypothetical protein HQ590_10780, partial [bacterium]|nr:hypothetical protein [bacterium]